MERASEKETEREREGGRAGERRGEDPRSRNTHRYIAATLTFPSCAGSSLCERKKRERETNREREREKERERGGDRRKINPGSLCPFFALCSFPLFFHLHHPRHEGGCQLARQNKRKGCFDCCLSIDKGQGRGRGGQHTAGTKNGISRMNGSPSAACARNSSPTLKSLNEVNNETTLSSLFLFFLRWSAGSRYTSERHLKAWTRIRLREI